MSGSVETLYQEQMQLLSPRERMDRCVAMFEWSRELVVRQIRAERGELGPEELRLELVKRIYPRDRELLQLIERNRDGVSH